MFPCDLRHLRARRQRLGDDLRLFVRGPVAPPLATRQNVNPHRSKDLKSRRKATCFADLAEQTRRSSPDGYVDPVEKISHLGGADRHRAAGD